MEISPPFEWRYAPSLVVTYLRAGFGMPSVILSGSDDAGSFVSRWHARWAKGVGSFRLATEVEWAKREPNGRF